MKIRAVPYRWRLLVELTVPSGKTVKWVPPGEYIHFKNGETLCGIEARKPSTPRNTTGIVRLYVSVLGHPKFITTPNIFVEPKWLDRTKNYYGDLPD
jgi:hypothetical protein